ncbi:hypothetical protein [Henriciella marina]|uniref:hypothetical protein n=1 Tax=Henriciella marina TaxID=453851 RepID=UPI0012EA4449|nr:hypothetical protein [Henriciella marina]
MGTEVSMRQILIGLTGLGLVAACEPSAGEERTGELPDKAGQKTLAQTAANAASNEVYGKPPNGTREALPQTLIEASRFTLTQQWELDGFTHPQGIVQTAAGDYLIANSSGGSDEAGADGWLSKVSADGDMVSERFATGMTAPGGMVIDRGVLYVADGSEIHMVDPGNGVLLRTISVPEAEALTDIAALNATLYAIDSANATLYQIAGAEVFTWFQDKHFVGARTLTSTADALLVPNADNGQIYLIDEARAISKAANAAKGINSVAEAPGGYLATAAPGKLIFVSQSAETETLLDTGSNGILQSHLHVFGDTVIALHPLPGAVTAWQIGPQKDVEID